MARKRNQTGIVAMSVKLDAAGNLLSAGVTGSSGFPLLDKAAAALVRKSCPFRHGTGRMIDINISVNYDLED